MPGTDLRFDLIVATVDRVTELERLLASLDAQTHRGFRVLVVDQNPDARLEPILAAHPELVLERLHSDLGLSRARNVALDIADADVVAFPDDDCAYPPDLLERVVAKLAARPELDGVAGIAREASGLTSERWPTEPRILAPSTVWHGGNSHTIFLRRSLLDRLGRFDEAMGFGSGNPWELAEEIDVLARAVLSGAVIEQDPTLVVEHVHRTYAGAELRVVARQSGGGVGYVLGKNRFPARVLARMAVRPVGGALRSLLRGDVPRARFHVTTLRWRIAGYRAGRRARSSSNSSA